MKKYGLPKVKNPLPVPKMKKPLLEKYVDGKLVEIRSLKDIKGIVVCSNQVQINKEDGEIITLTFDTYENACEGIKLIREKTKDTWDKEFEDEYRCICGYFEEDGICLEKTNIQELLETYINGKVKIKCKKGCIQIKRI